MNFNVYIDKQTGERLARVAKARRTTRNALIREALARLLTREAIAPWPREVLEFRGAAGAHPFERGRRTLGAPGADPLP